MIFIFATTYTWFVVARVIEGVGASLSFASASGMLSERFPDDHERGIILGRAQSGMSLGATVGPIYGGVLYYYFGKTVPFAILAGVVLIDGLLRLSIISKKPETDYENFRKKKNLGGCSTLMFLQDPLILITVGAIIVSLIGIRALQSILPIHMMIVSPTITSLQEGLIMVPLAIGFGTSQNTLGSLSFRVGRWLSCLIGFGGGTVLVSAAPILPRLIELRHSSSDFASVFALFDSAICLAAILGMM
ncbi:hypothetical protein I4U23_021812 [Adineta vaga]|nr:hypothetical protein I4U23_021812 [Adineta vaga]